MSSQIIWTTETVNETMIKLRQGADVDLGCFYEKNPELKAANILYQLTPDEEEEFIRCSSDINHFVSTYCKFLTDKGRTLVDLRNFQKEILNTLSEEKWIEAINDFGPKVNNYILMASRQTGKCQLFNTQLVVRFNSTNSLTTISIADLYNIVNKQNNKSFKQRIIYKIKKILYNIYNKLS